MWRSDRRFIPLFRPHQARRRLQPDRSTPTFSPAMAHYVFDVKTHLRAVLWTVALFLLAVTIFGIARYLRPRDFYDFVVYRIAGERALAATPLYRPHDGHYQFKYFPAFAVAAIPLAKIDLNTAIAGWFFLSFGLLVAFVRRSVRAL